MDSEFWAAIAGAVVGGALTIASQILTERQKEAVNRRAKAIALFAKIRRMHDNLRSIDRWLRDGLADAKRDNIEVAFATLEIANPFNETYLTDEEKLVAFLWSDPDLFREIENTEYAYNNILPLVREFSDGKRHLLDGLSISEHGPNIYRIELGEDAARKRAKIEALNALLADMTQSIGSDLQASEFALRGVMLRLRHDHRVKLAFVEKQAPKGNELEV